MSIVASANVAHYAGLETCGSIWACPVCSAKIRNTRAEEISAGAVHWDQAGNSVYMVTFTVPHDRHGEDMKLGRLLPLIADSFRKVIAGKAWVDLRKRVGVVGTIRSIEITHGPHGWHPHAHALVFVRGDPGAKGLADLALHFREKWERAVVAAGYRAPDLVHGVVIDRCTSAGEAGQYLAKLQDGKLPGLEMARSDLKSGRGQHRTPFEILESFRWSGDSEDLALWHIYERATKGHQCITWSKGLRKMLQVDERTDEELAAEEVGGELVAQIPADEWRRVVAVPGLAAHLLDQAERGGAEAVTAALARPG